MTRPVLRSISDGQFLAKAIWQRVLRRWQRPGVKSVLRQALPFALAALGATTLALVIFLQSEDALVVRFQREAIRAFRAREFRRAEVCYERLLALPGGASVESRFGLALTAEALGQRERARALMNQLAPPDRQGYGSAHLWQAKYLLGGGNASPASPQLLEAHLKRALQARPDWTEAQALLGMHFNATGRFGEAEPWLLKAARAMPELRLLLARRYAARGDQREARKQAELALASFQPQADKPDAPFARRRWAEAAVLLADFPTAVAVLEPGLGTAEAPAFRRALAGVYVAWADHLASNPMASLEERLVQVERGLTHDPENLHLLERLAEFASGAGPEAERARAALHALLTRGKSSATVHLLLGTQAQKRGAWDEARIHLEQAYQASPQTAVIANNLAWLLARPEKPDLPRALALIDGVLAHWPGEARFRETRGQILARMGRWSDALADLEAALATFSKSRRLHETLADTYRHLGMAELAEERARLAETLK